MYSNKTNEYSNYNDLLKRNGGARHFEVASRDNCQSSSPFAEASRLLTVLHLQLSKINPDNEVCQLTPATGLEWEYLTSPRSPVPANAENYNSNSTRDNTTLYPVTFQPNTGPRTPEYSLPRAGVLRPNPHGLLY